MSLFKMPSLSPTAHLTPIAFKPRLALTAGLFGVLGLISTASSASAQTYILQDEFNAAAFNTGLWNVHDSTWYIHRTRFGNTPQIKTEGTTSFARFTLDTFNAAYPGSKTKGTEIWSKNQIALGNGVEFETRMRATSLPRGLVMAFYTYKNRPFNDPSQQEIDIEILGNHAVNRLWYNIWTSTTKSATTSPTVTGLDRRNWVTYKVRWYKTGVQWLVNDVLVRTETNVVPTDAMSACYNFWAAESGWGDAYDSSLTVAGSAANNKSYYFDVDYIRVRALDALSTPYGAAAAAIPGTIQAENFDKGGEGVAYHDNDTANQGTAYRAAEGVDIEASTDTGGGYNVGWTGAGEWLKYSVNVAQAGTYNIAARIASNGGGGKFHIEFNGVDKTGPLTIPNTGGWQTYQTVTKTGVALAAGPQSMRVVLDSVGASGSVGNLNSFVFTTAAPTDTIKPVVAINNPVAGYSYKTLPQIGGTASDSGGSNLASVKARLQRVSDKLYWNGSAWAAAATELAATGTANWTFKLPALADGKYTVSAVARDGAANATTSAGIDFFIDNLAPVIAITTPTANATYSSLGQASGTARDAGGGTAQVRANLQRLTDNYYWNGSSWTAAVTEIGSAGLDTWYFGFPALPAGRYVFKVNAQDYVGNKSVSAPVTFTIGSTARQVLAPKSTGKSSVVLSSATANAAAETVTLSFTGPVHAASAEATPVVVNIYGSLELPVIATRNDNASTVTLSLPKGSIDSGETLTLLYNLLDGNNLPVNGKTSVTVR